MNQDTESVPDCLARLQRLRDRFAECGGVLDEAMYEGKMFEGLQSLGGQCQIYER
jgi:hypothetical protein